MIPLRIGSRGSKLALWQAEHIGERLLQECNAASEIVIIKTSGDHFASAPVPKLSDEIGGKGIFIKEIEDALLARRVDLAVHSLKDVPVATPHGLCFPAITRREDARDCLVSRRGESLANLPKGACVGTSSLRRQSQLLNFRPDLKVTELRGNVDTRLRKLDAGDFDAILLAKAGLDRLGLAGRVTEIIPPEIILPAVGQGALAIETRAANSALRHTLAAFDDAGTRLATAAERALLAELEGGCQVPLGAWAVAENGSLRLFASVLSAEGKQNIRRSASAPVENLREAQALGRTLARELLAAGADRLLRLAGRAAGKSGR